MAYCDCGSPATVDEAAGTSIARTASYEYDFQGKRWKTTTLEGSMIANHSHALIIQERNAGHTPQVTYTRGLDLSGTIEGAGGIGGLLMRSHGYSAGNWSTHNAYHSDANGNVTALMNSSGVLQASYKYNPYGGLISSSGTLAGANTMRFSSKPAIFSTTGSWGFYYYGYRFYDPGMQRWLNRDPLGEKGFKEGEFIRGRAIAMKDHNLFSFISNSPVEQLDYFGLQGERRHNCAPCTQRHYQAAGFADREACANAYWGELTGIQLAGGAASVGATVIAERAAHKAVKSAGGAGVGGAATIGGVSVAAVFASAAALGGGLQWLTFYDLCYQCTRTY
jgi:RHS repeat-associated protein